jgi:hydroxymethylpyrimidine/phosphomethylpyrimidine kinase
MRNARPYDLWDNRFCTIRKRPQSLSMSQNYPAVLVFAGTDPTGGAGLQADVLTLASLGCHPLSVVTAVTVQDTLGVEDFLVLDAMWVADQARAVLEDMPVAAIKIGMIGSAEIVSAIAEVISDYPDIPVVLDPIVASGRGDELADEDLIDAMRDLLLPQTTLLTPNSLEARRLAQDEAEDDVEPDLDLCAERLLDLGCEYVLITGSHEQSAEVDNALYGRDGEVQTLSWERLPGSYHGSGCTLASACAALLAQGMSVPEAVKAAQEFTYQTLRFGYRRAWASTSPTACSGRATTNRMLVRGLYAVTPDWADTPRLIASTEAILRAGCRIVQYRNKTASPCHRDEQAVALRGLTRRYGALLIVNDDVELALTVEADGAHLGGEDGDLADPRRRRGRSACSAPPVTRTSPWRMRPSPPAPITSPSAASTRRRPSPRPSAPVWTCSTRRAPVSTCLSPPSAASPRRTARPWRRPAPTCSR